VDNTSDANKPVSTLTQTALNEKAPINNPTFTGTVSGIDKNMIGLGNVDNISDANKPVSTAIQNSLNAKVNIADTANMLQPYLRDMDTTAMLANYLTALNTKAPINNPTFTGTVSGITKTMVGLPDVDNTSDANKPVSTATQTALNLKVNIADTASMLTPYLRKRDTTSLSNRINLKVNIADTASMLMPYLRKRDTASLSNRINLKLNISDTAAMLLNYRNNGSSGSGLPTTGNSLGNMLYWNGSAWVKLPTGSNGQILQIDGGIPAWANPDFICGVSKLWDIDNNKYNTVKIVSQCWMSENLRVSSYNEGTPIPIVTGNSAWGMLTTGGRSWYNNDSTANEIPYGNLYNWYAAKGIASAGSTSYKNICPEGWRVPTDGDWDVLVAFLNGSSQAGGKMKSTGNNTLGTGLWDSPNTAATNESGFSALPGGYRESNNNFGGIRSSTTVWSSTPNDPSTAYYRYMNYNDGVLGRTFTINQVGGSIRCLKE
jgi:uncharacterized protein (TIGR02145 family)